MREAYPDARRPDRRRREFACVRILFALLYLLGHTTRTFEVAGHYYGLVVAGGLRPGAEYEYQVALDCTVRWPEPDSPFPPSVLRRSGREPRGGSASGFPPIVELPGAVGGEGAWHTRKEQHGSGRARRAMPMTWPRRPASARPLPR